MPVNDVDFSNLRDRIVSLERDHVGRDIVDRLVTVERNYAVMQEVLNPIKADLAAIKATLSRITWIILGAIGAAVMTFILNGGLDTAAKAASSFAWGGGF